MTLTVPLCLMEDGAKVPTFAHPGDGGADLRSTIELTLRPFERATVPCGFSMALPEGHAALVIPRSGLAAKHGISIVNAPGLIDSGYRGEVKVVLVNLDPQEDFTIHVGDRIAQMMVVRIPNVELEVVDELDITSRSSKGFGSSGV